MKIKRKMTITVTGGIGVGKTSMLMRIINFVETLGFDAVVSSEPDTDKVYISKEW